MRHNRLSMIIVCFSGIFFGTLLGALPGVRADDPAAPEKPAKPVISKKAKKKTKPAPLAEALSRGVVACEKVTDAKLCRATVFPSSGSGEINFVVVIEIPCGDLAIFQGSEDPEEDSLVVVSQRELDMLNECLLRSKDRGKK